MNTFHVGSLSSFSETPLIDAYEAKRVATTPDYKAAGFLERQLPAAVTAMCSMEHEHFHARTILSTTFGWLLFYLAQVQKSYKVDILDRARGRASLGANLYDSLMNSEPELMIRFHQHMVILNCVWTPSVYNFKSMRPFRSGSPDSGFLPKTSYRDFDLIKGIMRPSVSELKRQASLGGAMDILESLALWREFAVASLLFGAAMGTDSWMFYDQTDKFIRERTQKISHRRAADAIVRLTGCGLSRQLPGLLFDMALSPPLFREGTSWEEFHPSTRLLRLAQAAAEVRLPEDFYRPNFEPVQNGAYEEADDKLSKHLGWTSSRSNLVDLFDWISRNNERERMRRATGGETEMEHIFRGVYETWFGNCIGNKVHHLGAFAFPSSEAPTFTFSLEAYAQPACMVYPGYLFVNDKVTIEAFRPFLVIDSLTHIFLDSYLSPVPATHVSFELARYFYEGAKGWCAFSPDSRLSHALGDNFDMFATELTGLDWSTSRSAF